MDTCGRPDMIKQNKYTVSITEEFVRDDVCINVNEAMSLCQDRIVEKTAFWLVS